MQAAISVLGLSIFLTFGYPKLSFAAAPICAKSIQGSFQKDVLGDLRSSLRKASVRQCEGSCYFEAVVSPLEAKLSTHFGRSVTVSRPHLFANLLMMRLAVLSVGGKGLFAFQESKHGITDIVSNGNVLLMSSLINNTGLRIMGPKSQAYLHKENAVMKDLYNTSGQLVYDLLHARPQKRFKTKAEAAADTSATLKASIISFMPKLKKILETSELSVPDAVTNFKIKPKNFDLEFEVGDQLSSALETRIIETLSKGEELTLVYFHINSYVKKRHGRDGFLTLSDNPIEKSEAEKNKKGGSHAVAVVDVIKNMSGRIEYIVIRNSWGGQGRSDRGYHYISIKYLKHYGGSVLDWSLQFKTD